MADTKDMIHHLFWLMPNITSSTIKTPPILFDSNMRDVVSCLKRSPHRLVNLDLWAIGVSDEEMTHPVNLYSESLRDLLVDDCQHLKEGTFAAIGHCSQLRHLSLEGAYGLKNCYLLP